MFVYNYFAEDHRLYVSIPLEITFDRTFLDDIVGLFDAVLERIVRRSLSHARTKKHQTMISLYLRIFIVV